MTLLILKELGLKDALFQTEHIKVQGVLLGFPSHRLVPMYSPRKKICGVDLQSAY